MDTGLFKDPCSDYSASLTQHCPGLKDLDASIFLHGVCGLFALALHQMKGWEIVSLYDPEEDSYGYTPNHANFPVAHVFCVTEDSLLADCRGVTDSEQKFCEEFEDFFTEPAYYHFSGEDYEIFRESLYQMIGNDADILLAFALDYIQMHKDYYEA